MMDKRNDTFAKIAESIKEEAKLQTENLSEAQKRVLSEEFIDITDEPVIREKIKPEPIKIEIHREAPRPEPIKPEIRGEAPRPEPIKPEIRGEAPRPEPIKPEIRREEPEPIPELVDDFVEEDRTNVPQSRVLGMVVDESVEEPPKEAPRPHTKHIGRRVFVAFVTLIAVIYVIGFVVFEKYYIPGTTIGDRSVDFCKKDDIIQEYSSNQYPFCLIMRGTDQRELIIDSEAIGAGVKYDIVGLKEEKDNKKLAMIWPYYAIVGHNIPVRIMTEYDDNALDKVIKSSDIFKEKGEESKNASLAYVDGIIEIVGESIGTEPDFYKTKKAVKKALTQMSAGEKAMVVSMSDADCYRRPSLTKDDSDMLDSQCRAQSIVDSVITYDWNGNEEIVDGKLISQWLIFNGVNISIDEKKVEAFVNEKAGLYDTYGKNLLFHTTDSGDKNIERHGYGWKTDVEKETEALIQNILNGDVISKEPIYAYEGYVKGINDVGDSYVEINLSAQHLFLYIKGELIHETDVVSGGPPNGKYTPDGIYGITYKTRNAVLRGPGYETPVSYWMPYNGGIGLHDAKWRAKFGGTIYQTSGSHGCVNLPADSASLIYENVCTNFPVVTYW